MAKSELREYALISVSNKEGIESLARAFVDRGLALLATGGTHQVLKALGFDVTEVSDWTGEPERMGGRVKTLHHRVLGGVLFRPGVDDSDWPYPDRIAAVVCNFYPFESKAKSIQEIPSLMEWVDIGGPTMVRAAAKNHQHVWVLTNPDQYARFIAVPQAEESALRARLAIEAFSKVEELDHAIVREFQWRQPFSTGAGTLEYGENPHQKAFFLPERSAGLRSYGRLSFNNWRDAEAALRFVSGSDPTEGASVAVIKHQTLCGAAVGARHRADEVFFAAWESDPVSRFGAVVGLNFLPGPEASEELKKRFVEVLLLPRTSESELWAENFVSEKDRVSVVLVDPSLFNPKREFMERVSGRLGRLDQSSDTPHTSASESLEAFGEWAAACSKSNAVVLVADHNGVFTLAGAGQGQPNRIDALEKLAIPRAADWCQRHKRQLSELVCVSDGFFPFVDALKVLAGVGVKRLVQPGGSKSDADVSRAAKELNIEMTRTGRRHFWH